MKKWLITLSVIIIVLAIIVLGAPFIIGKLAADRYQYFIGQIAQTKYLNVKMVDYKRSWFSSEAIIQITVNPQLRVLPSQSPSKPVILNITQTIMHGPILYAPINGHKQFMLGLAYIHSNIKQRQIRLEAVTHIKFDNSVNYSGNAPFVTITFPQDKRNYLFKDIRLQGNTQLDFNALSGTMAVGEMNIRDPHVSEQLNNFVVDYGLIKSKLGL